MYESFSCQPSRAIYVSLGLLLAGVMQAGCGGEQEVPDDEATVETGTVAVAGAGESDDIDERLGEPRDDLERFYGIYGSEDSPDRDFFVTKADLGMDTENRIPAGYIMIGATWGDVAPWVMRSVSETEFVEAYITPESPQDVIGIKFEVDASGKAESMSFTSGVFADRGTLQREGDVPEGL